MTAIRGAEVTITPVYLVDCRVCREFVEPDAAETINGGFQTRAAAAEAKRNHLQEHANGEWG